jgi:hypothetical protein
MRTSLELFFPEDAATTLVPNLLIATSYGTNYLKLMMIPGSGNFFAFANKLYAIIDATTGAEVEQNFDWGAIYGTRSGGLPAAAVPMPMFAEADGTVASAEFIFMGGGVGDADPTAIASVARISVTVATADRVWEYDEDMPYGRICSDGILQPNGHICLFNGWRFGLQGVDNYGSVTDVFCFNPEAPLGERWNVYASTPTRRHYHSAATMLPSGRTAILGHDQATYDGATQYQHKGELFTPPWLLDGTPRPVIEAAPEFVYYGLDFSITYSGAPVTRVSVLAPGSTTHGTEMNQRMLILNVKEQSEEWLTVGAPFDSTVMLTGHHMLFLCNDNTPSEAVWIQFAYAPDGYETSVSPTVRPTAILSTSVPSVMPSAIPSAEPSAIPSAEPSVIPSAEPSAIPSAEPSAVPSEAPSAMPSADPSADPSEAPSAEVSAVPSTDSSADPSAIPSADPSEVDRKSVV